VENQIDRSQEERLSDHEKRLRSLEKNVATLVEKTRTDPSLRPTLDALSHALVETEKDVALLCSAENDRKALKWMVYSAFVAALFANVRFMWR
jgi:hypothetical protein